MRLLRLNFSKSALKVWNSYKKDDILPPKILMIHCFHWDAKVKLTRNLKIFADFPLAGKLKFWSSTNFHGTISWECSISKVPQHQTSHCDFIHKDSYSHSLSRLKSMILPGNVLSVRRGNLWHETVILQPSHIPSFGVFQLIYSARKFNWMTRFCKSTLSSSYGKSYQNENLFAWWMIYFLEIELFTHQRRIDSHLKAKTIPWYPMLRPKTKLFYNSGRRENKQETTFFSSCNSPEGLKNAGKRVVNSYRGKKILQTKW